MQNINQYKEDLISLPVIGHGIRKTIEKIEIISKCNVFTALK